jgi:hypothetical protein
VYGIEIEDFMGIKSEIGSWMNILEKALWKEK